MCTPIISKLATTITSNLKQIAGIKNESVMAGDLEMTDQQRAYKVLMSIIDLIRLMLKYENGKYDKSSQFDVINNISELSLKLFIDILNNKDPKIDKTQLDDIANQSYSQAVDTLIKANLFDIKNDLMIAKNIIIE